MVIAHCCRLQFDTLHSGKRMHLVDHCSFRPPSKPSLGNDYLVINSSTRWATAGSATSAGHHPASGRRNGCGDGMPATGRAAQPYAGAEPSGFLCFRDRLAGARLRLQHCTFPILRIAAYTTNALAHVHIAELCGIQRHRLCEASGMCPAARASG
jgi:hypothetical protein